MALRRGFVGEANEIALSIRKELGLIASAPLSPWLVAEHLDIPVVKMSSLSNQAAAAVAHFSHRSQSDFSGATVFNGLFRMIVHNDSHALGRQANDVSHEIAHALLGHKPGPVLDQLGCRFWDGKIEEEADRLGGTLLVSEEAAMSIARRGMTDYDAALEYGISVPLMTFRLRITNARVRVARGERKRA